MDTEKIKEEYGYDGKPKQWQIGFDALLKHISDYEDVLIKVLAAQTYQIIGALTTYDAVYSKEEHTRALDYFCDIANGERDIQDDFLPWG